MLTIKSELKMLAERPSVLSTMTNNNTSPVKNRAFAPLQSKTVHLA